MMDRIRLNAITILVTFICLLVTLKLGDGSFANRINKISENLDRALSEVMVQNTPIYTNITDNATYVSRVEFNPKGMGGLYNLTIWFMDFIITKDIYPEGIIIVENHRIQLGDIEEQWQNILTKYAGLFAMIIIIIFLMILMPFCGFCFCCCRCCGHCGARSQPFDKKHDLCKKILYATLLIGLGTLLLFGVVCAFASNQHTEEGVNDLTDNLRKSIKDTNTYLLSTNKQVKTLLDRNYDEFETVLLNTMEESNNIVYNELKNYSNATSMLELAEVVEKLPKIRTDFDTLKYSTNSLRVYASQLNDAVRKVKKDLLATLAKCTHVKCTDINKNISSLQTSIHFNNLPDISDQIKTLEELPLDEFRNAVVKGIRNLEEIKVKIGETVNGTIRQARLQINKAGVELKRSSHDVTRTIYDLKKKFESNANPAVDNIDYYLRRYGFYRYYIGLATSCVLLLVSVCVALGLICGICGKRPDVYGDDCCNKGAGSQFLIWAVMIMFLLSFAVAAVTLIGFLSGVLTQRVICAPMRDPANSKVFDLIDEGVALTDVRLDVNVSAALQACYRNDTIYNVLNLKNYLDLNEIKNYLSKYNIDGILNSLDMGSVGFGDNFHILEDDDRDVLEQLAQSDFANIDFDHFKDVLEYNFTTVNLTDLSNELGELIKQIENVGDVDNILSDLKLSKLHLESYQEKIVDPMTRNATAVVKLAKELDNDLKLGHTSFKEAIEDMLNELSLAEQTLIHNGTENLQKIAENFTKGIIGQVQNYLDRVVYHTEYEVGKCGPLSLVINATLNSTCDKIILPWNGFWFSLFCSLVLFIPSIIISVKLATLYQKYSPYSGHLVEAEYLYDAYADRDNVPLNSRGGKMKKKKNKKYKRYEDRGNATAGGSTNDASNREYPGGSMHQDATRYVEMGPKQWEDFPADGPPQYQRAPTEYERPPPYYYPGAAGDNQ